MPQKSDTKKSDRKMFTHMQDRKETKTCWLMVDARKQKKIYMIYEIMRLNIFNI